MLELTELRRDVFEVGNKVERLIGRVDATLEHVVTRDRLNKEINTHIENFHRRMSRRTMIALVAVLLLATGTATAAFSLFGIDAHASLPSP